MEIAPGGLARDGGGEVRVFRDQISRRGGRGLNGCLAGKRVVLSTVTVQMGRAVKLLPALLTLEDGDLVQEGVPIEVVCPVESLATDLAEKYLILWVRVSQNVPLEKVLLQKTTATDLTRHGNVFSVTFRQRSGVPNVRRLARVVSTLDKSQPLAIHRVTTEQAAHEGTCWYSVSKLQLICITAGVNWSFKLHKIFGLGEIYFDVFRHLFQWAQCYLFVVIEVSRD